MYDRIEATEMWKAVKNEMMIILLALTDEVVHVLLKQAGVEIVQVLHIALSEEMESLKMMKNAMMEI